ncbi:MAG: GGDEF domain-containing protein [Candidatus Competibacter sp.]|nr:GGDEF domain-containing protein [Candidatus Competibacter sp.]MDG4584990.1 GGDEF domain-containing protein [Candidatus Competibacter sp.]
MNDAILSLESIGLPAFLQELGSVVIMLLDENSRILAANRGFLRLASSLETGGQPWDARTLFLSPHLEDVQALVPYQGRALLLYRGMLNMVRADRQTHSLQGHIYHWPQGRLLVAAECDMEGLEALGATVLQLNAALARIRRQSSRANREPRRNEAMAGKPTYFDLLTEVGNRRRLEETVAAEVERSRRHRYPLCLLIADLDHFRQINERWGRTTGDEVLRDFATLLRAHSRQGDLVARFGEDGFVVLLPETLLEPAATGAECLRQRLEWRSILPRHGPITASFGVAMRAEGEGGENLLWRVGQALCRSKREGRNRVTQSIASGQNAAPNVSSC